MEYENLKPEVQKLLSRLTINSNFKLEELINLYEEGYSVYDLVLKYKINFYSMKKLLSTYGIKVRNASEQKLITMNKPEVKKRISDSSIKSSGKRKETNLKKYGTSVPANGINWKDNYEKEHGVRHPNQREEAKENMRGDNNPAKRAESKQKIKEERWDKKTQEELDLIWDKTKETWKNNMGVDNPLKSPIIVESLRKLSRIERGVEWHTQDPDVKNKSLKTHISKVIDKISNKLNDLNLELVNEFKNITCITELRCKVCNNTYKTVLDYVFNGHGLCPFCNPKNTSINEREIRNFIGTIIPINEIIFNDRKLLNGKEIDILIPLKKLAIEHDGIFYHSEKRGVFNNYHIDKTNKCLKKGYELLHIFEDEWSYKRELIKDKLLFKLDPKKLKYEEKILINKIQNTELIKNFILINDLYEFFDYDICMIIFSKHEINNLLGLVTFKKIENNNWKIINFCVKNSYSPLYINDIIENFIRSYNPYRLIVETDKRFLDKDIFKNFKVIGEIKPDYTYFKSLERKTKRELSNLSNNNPDDYAINNGWFKIWDCGKYVLEYKKQT